MKEYMITSFDLDTYEVHKHIGGGAYYAVFHGTHNEVAKFLNDNGITDYGYGF